MAKKNPHAVALGRRGGLAGKGVSTPARRRAARTNGKLGGRPRPADSPLYRPCPTCEAKAGWPCVAVGRGRAGETRKEGQPIRLFHRARM